MLLQNLHCPYGCEKTTFTESTRQINEPTDNLLLDSETGTATKRSVKVYTCNCCHNTFEIPQQSPDSKQIL